MNQTDHSGSGQQKAEKHAANVMAETVERWLGNPLARKVLKFCTKRDGCGRRIDLVLRRYIGQNPEMCFRCRAACRIINFILNKFAGRMGIEKNVIEENLKDFMFRKGLGSVLEGLAEFGPAKPFTSYSPFLIVWNYTNACNLRCKHCYQRAGKQTPDELTTKEVMDAIDRMGKMGVAYIALSGGEPLIRKDFFEAARRMQKNEIAFSIATNGTLLTKENVKKLEEVGCRYIQISLDGATAKTHDWLRGKGAFDKAMTGIKNAVESKITVGLATTVTSENVKEVPKIIDLAEKVGADIWMHYNFIPAGRGEDIVRMDIEPDERERLLKYLSERTKRSKIKLLSTAPQYGRVSVQCDGSGSMSNFDIFSQQEGSNVKFLADFVGGCGEGRLYIALQPNGDITPCVFMPKIVIGNVRKDDLEAVWKSSEVLKKARDRTKFGGHCCVCEFRNLCGGCRARAYGYFGDVTACDPGCIYNKKEWVEIKKCDARKA